MKKKFASISSLKEFGLWGKLADRRIPLSFDLEITARCNNNCRHCYLNLPAGDSDAQKRELSAEDIEKIAEQAVDLGSLWCLISGGEPLLREDFSDIYMRLKKKGLLVSVFTNACLIKSEHIALFKKFPPRDIEVTVYGVTEETYESVTRKSGSFAAFRQGFDLLINNDIKVRLKAMALRSNFHELPAIAAFCRKYTMDYFRFDPLLHLRYDRNKERNQEIISERLTAEEIVQLEQADPDRSDTLIKHCDHFIFTETNNWNCQHLFHCGAGNGSFTVSPEGFFRLCASLWHPDCIYDLKKGSLTEAWEVFVPQVRGQTSADPEFLTKCRSCPIINLCLWCPAHAYLESGRLDAWSEYFCTVAHARQAAIEKNQNSPKRKKRTVF
ncbi:MAG: radical SAM protein [Candidatus Aminicenantes bacterium]|nr:radical SAM protein [Candidatus Aminicenantes bacterium]